MHDRPPGGGIIEAPPAGTLTHGGAPQLTFHEPPTTPTRSNDSRGHRRRSPTPPRRREERSGKDEGDRDRDRGTYAPEHSIYHA